MKERKTLNQLIKIEEDASASATGAGSIASCTPVKNNKKKPKQNKKSIFIQ